MLYKIDYVEAGKPKSIKVSAKDVTEAIKKFKQSNRKGFIKNIEIVEEKKLIDLKKLNLFSSVNLEEFNAVLEQMYVMLDAGMSIDIVMENVISGVKNRNLKKVLLAIYNDIKAGFSLTDAFKKHQDKFGSYGNIIISMIKLGEETGDLARTIKDLSVILSEIVDNKKKLKKATHYPVMIIVAMIIAFVVVVMFVIPTFKSIFAQIGSELPLPTRILLGMEWAFRHFGLLIIVLLTAFIIFLIYTYRTNEKFRFYFDKYVLKVYIIGKIMHLSMIGRFVFVLQRLVEAGLPIFEAIEIGFNIVDNDYMKSRLILIKKSIEIGGGIAKGFRDTELFEEMIVQMIQAGEESGALVHMLDKVSKYYLDKYRYIIDNISTVIEPLLILVIAGFVTMLALGIFLPMWSLTQMVKG